MSVVAAHLYRNGKDAKAVSLDEPIDCKGKSEFVWIGLFEPSEQELEQLEKNYGLHPLAIEDALKANQLPKVDVYGDQLFVMTRTAHLEHDHIAYGETAIFVGKNFIITVRHGSARAHSDLRAQYRPALYWALPAFQTRSMALTPVCGSPALPSWAIHRSRRKVASAQKASR